MGHEPRLIVHESVYSERNGKIYVESSRRCEHSWGDLSLQYMSEYEVWQPLGLWNICVEIEHSSLKHGKAGHISNATNIPRWYLSGPPSLTIPFFKLITGKWWVKSCLLSPLWFLNCKHQRLGNSASILTKVWTASECLDITMQSKLQGRQQQQFGLWGWALHGITKQTWWGCNAVYFFRAALHCM